MQLGFVNVNACISQDVNDYNVGLCNRLLVIPRVHIYI